MKPTNLILLFLASVLIMGCSWKINNSVWLYVDGIYYGDIINFEGDKFLYENDTVYRTKGDGNTSYIGSVVEHRWGKLVIKNSKGEFSTYKEIN
jgi:hypothetical protein